MSGADDPEPALAVAVKPLDPSERVAIGVQAFWVQGKVMPGIVVRAGKGWWSLAFETSLIWLTASDPKQIQGRTFLGSQFGLFLGVSPLHTPRYELGAGVGCDFYPLWHIARAERQVALALRAEGHLTIAWKLGVFATVRGYPLTSKGLELGTERNGDSGLPVLFTTGLERRFP